MEQRGTNVVHSPARRSARAWRLLVCPILALGALVLSAGAVAAADPIGDAPSSVADQGSAPPLVEAVAEDTPEAAVKALQPVVDPVVESPPVQAARPILESIVAPITGAIPPEVPLPDVPLPDVPLPNVPRPDIPVIEGPARQLPEPSRGPDSVRIPVAALELEPASDTGVVDLTPFTAADAPAAAASVRSGHPQPATPVDSGPVAGTSTDAIALSGEAGPIAAVIALVMGLALMTRSVDLSLVRPNGRLKLVLAPPG